MTRPGSLLWFAHHEFRLSWRDVHAMFTAGRRRSESMAIITTLAFVIVLHGIAFLVLGRIGGRAIQPDLQTLITLTATMLLSGSAMLSQAMESVTRAFYSRSDLELILSSPADTNKLFAVRIAAIALSVGAMSLLIAGPFINVLALRGGWQWLAAYGVIEAVALVATAFAVLTTLALFRAIGPRRTRFAAQVAAAIIGAAFVIGLQIAAMLSTGSLSRSAILHSSYVAAHAPALDSVFWWPARAALGDGLSLAVVLTVSLALFFVVTLWASSRFAGCALAAGSVARDPVGATGKKHYFRANTASHALRRKERLLLLRDPWLMSQSLMQLLYLLPPALLLWRTFTFRGNAVAICVPVLIMAAGQLAGGLAWLTISGEAAPDLVATAPVPLSRVLAAKIESVMGIIAVVFAPFILALAFISRADAMFAAIGIIAAAASATAIQLWFRTQARRSQFRRRQTSSRIATFAEAFSSIAWAATGAIAAGGSALAAIMALIALAILATVRRLAPAGTIGKNHLAAA